MDKTTTVDVSFTLPSVWSAIVVAAVVVAVVVTAAVVAAVFFLDSRWGRYIVSSSSCLL